MINSTKSDREYITTPEASERSGLSKNYLTLLCRNGALEGFRIGQAREWFIYTDSLESFLAKKRKPGPRPGSKRTKPTELQAEANSKTAANRSETE